MTHQRAQGLPQPAAPGSSRAGPPAPGPRRGRTPGPQAGTAAPARPTSTVTVSWLLAQTPGSRRVKMWQGKRQTRAPMPKSLSSSRHSARASPGKYRKKSHDSCPPQSSLTRGQMNRMNSVARTAREVRVLGSGGDAPGRASAGGAIARGDPRGRGRGHGAGPRVLV